MTGIAGNGSLRLTPLPDPSQDQPADVQVEVTDGEDAPEYDESGNVLRIRHADGDITISLDGKPVEEARREKKALGWFDNLADEITQQERSRIVDDLLRGVEEDKRSRQEWIDDRALGVKLLALKVELPVTQGATDGAPVEGMSKVRHPLLLEAVLRFQANARGEFLPVDGPVKIRNDAISTTPALDELASALEIDMNHYLTAVATEYYPDTDRMFFMTGFGGDGFKKVYYCPLRMRPVSESVNAEDLIVNNSATDLENAQRVTHRVMLRRSTVKRMQILGVYRDIELSDPVVTQPDELEQAKKEQQGISVNVNNRPEDREREIYEIKCELNIAGFEHKKNDKETGLEIPYVVTIDTSAREMLACVRNYRENDEPLPTAKKRFVKYPFAPGLGFYDIGLLHILGNTTNAVTAAWRLMLDNGMFANFPGYLTGDSGPRQNTNVFRVPPGGSAQVKTGGVPIREFVMELPYNTQGMPALMQLTGDMAETGRRLGGTAEVQVGEGRADVPVGTVMAMIDQAVKVMSAVHKRMHAAQAEEFQLLRDLFKEHPESLYERGCKSRTTWDKAKVLQALNDCNLVPQADPNTSSNAQRLMKIMGLFQLASDAPQLYDPIKKHKLALRAMGWSNPEDFFVPPEAQAQPPPQVIEAQQNMANETKSADAKMLDAQSRAKDAQTRETEVHTKAAQGGYAPAQGGGVVPMPEPETSLDKAKTVSTLLDAHTRATDAQTRRGQLELEHTRMHVEDQNRDQDRDARTRDAAVGLAKELLKTPAGGGGKGPDGKPKAKPKPHATPKNVGSKTQRIVKQIDKGLDTQ